jgi:hypothetical protein
MFHVSAQDRRRAKRDITNFVMNVGERGGKKVFLDTPGTRFSKVISLMQSHWKFPNRVWNRRLPVNIA